VSPGEYDGSHSDDLGLEIMTKKKTDKPEEIRVRLRAPVDKLDLDVLNVGGIFHSGKVIESLRVDVSQESEITHNSNIVPDTPPHPTPVNGPPWYWTSVSNYKRGRKTSRINPTRASPVGLKGLCLPKGNW
jgi:hypothetical protein